MGLTSRRDGSRQTERRKARRKPELTARENGLAVGEALASQTRKFSTICLFFLSDWGKIIAWEGVAKKTES
jgi:hypothetical protein